MPAVRVRIIATMVTQPDIQTTTTTEEGNKTVGRERGAERRSVKGVGAESGPRAEDTTQLRQSPLEKQEL